MRKLTTELLRRLRVLMKDPLHTGGEVLSAYVVPSCDAHNSEYLCPRVKKYNCQLCSPPKGTAQLRCNIRGF
jgi:hypothetical protein